MPVVRVPDYNENEIELILSAKTDCEEGSCLRDTTLLFVKNYDVNTDNLVLSVTKARDEAQGECATVGNDERDIAKYVCY